MNTEKIKPLDEEFRKQLMGSKNIFHEKEIEYGTLQSNPSSIHSETTNYAESNASMQLQSDAFKEFVNIHPSFIEKWGLMSIMCLVALILFISYFIPYPEKMQCEVKIHSENAPKELRSKLSGKVLSILKTNEEKVFKNDPILLIESNADHNEIQLVYDELKKAEQYFKQGNEYELRHLFHEKHSQLGELQNAYQLFFQEFIEFKNVIHENYYQRKQVYIIGDIRQVDVQKKALASQQMIAKQQFKLIKDKYERYELLYNEKVISMQELEQERIAYLNKKSELEQFHISSSRSEEQALQKKNEILDIEHDMSGRGRNLYENLLTLISEFEQWNKEHIITSPADGYIQYNSFLETAQLLKADEIFAQIVSTQEVSYYAELRIPHSSIEKIQVGKRVLLSFDGYNYSDYGFVEAKITYLSKLPMDSVYLGKAEIQKDFKSKSHKMIPLKHNMRGFGHVIISDASILERVCKDLWNKVHK